MLNNNKKVITTNRLPQFLIFTFKTEICVKGA